MGIPERVGALEERYADIKDDVGEIKGDVKILVAAHNQEKGFRLGAKGKSFVKSLGVGVGVASPFAAIAWKVWG
jgi:hypothetical protein